MGYLFRISFLGYNLKSYPDFQKISYNILSYRDISFHIHKYPKISAGANSQMNVVGTERHNGLEKGQTLPGETVHTSTVEKLG